MSQRDVNMPPAAAGPVLGSPSFPRGGSMPVLYSCDGADVSPGLAWGSVPGETRRFALIMDDLDGPDGSFTHWVFFNLPVEVRELPEALPKTEQLGPGGEQGRNDFGKIGYNGPCPPPGPAHRYRFTLYALDGPLDLGAGATRDEVLKAMEGHILGQAELIGTYERRG